MVNIPSLKVSRGSLPKLGLGTWLIGGAMKRDPLNDDVGQIKALRYALEAGFTWIRTAHNYAEGHCHELISQAITSFDRKTLFISEAINQNFATSKDVLIAQAKKSLSRLKVDYFDLFIIGAVNPNVPIQEIADGLMDLLDKGLTKNIGVSNYRLEELKFINDYTGGKVLCDEMHYNLVIREPEITGELKYCQDNGIILSAYRPLQLGQLSKPGISLLDRLAKKYHKSPSQIALKWLVQKDSVVAIVRALAKTHVNEDLDLFDWQLELKDIDSLDQNFPIQIRVSDCSLPRKARLN